MCSGAQTRRRKGQVLSVTRGARAHDREVNVETYGFRLQFTELRHETTRQAACGYSVVRQSLSLPQSATAALSEFKGQGGNKGVWSSRICGAPPPPAPASMGVNHLKTECVKISFATTVQAWKIVAFVPTETRLITVNGDMTHIYVIAQATLTTVTAKVNLLKFVT